MRIKAKKHEEFTFRKIEKERPIFLVFLFAALFLRPQTVKIAKPASRLAGLQHPNILKFVGMLFEAVGNASAG